MPLETKSPGDSIRVSERDQEDKRGNRREDKYNYYPCVVYYVAIRIYFFVNNCDVAF